MGTCSPRTRSVPIALRETGSRNIRMRTENECHYATSHLPSHYDRSFPNLPDTPLQTVAIPHLITHTPCRLECTFIALSRYDMPRQPAQRNLVCARQVTSLEFHGITMPGSCPAIHEYQEGAACQGSNRSRLPC